MDGEAELRCRSRVDGDDTKGVETLGDCRALELLAVVTGVVAGPALEDLASSPLLIFPVSISLTIN